MKNNLTNSGRQYDSSKKFQIQEQIRCQKQDRPQPVLVQKSGRVDDDMQISAVDVFCEMDGRESRCVKEVLDWYREEDAGGLRRSELNDQVESMTCLNAFWESEKSNQNLVMNEKYVKNSVMNAKIDPGVVMDLSVFKIGGWNILQPGAKNCWKNLLMR